MLILKICIANSYPLSNCASFTSVILWIGDLNYRISDLDVDNVKELISKKDFEALHNYDQVISTMGSSFCCLNSLNSSFVFRVMMLTSCIWSSAQEADR